MLTKVSASNGPRNQRGARCKPSAAIVPTTVDDDRRRESDRKLLTSAAWTTVSCRTDSYQRRLKPSHCVTRRFVRVEAEDHDDEDRDVEEQVDEDRVAT